MKQVTLAIIISVLVLFSISCKKDKNDTPAITETGDYEGKYSTTRVIAAGDTTFTEIRNNYALRLILGGTVEVFDGLLNSSAKATGTYTISGDDLNVTYAFGTGSPLYLRGKTNPSRTAINGTWHYTNGRTGGQFYFYKK